MLCTTSNGMDEQKNENNNTEIDKLTKCEQEKEEYLNNWKRERADILNYKKDEAKRMEEFVRFANEDLLMETIETLDDLEKAAKEINNDGLNQVLKKFQDLLGKYGTERIKVKDEKFDPALHEAIESEDGGDKLKEVRAGYTMHGRVIRPARVKIINRPTTNDQRPTT